MRKNILIGIALLSIGLSAVLFQSCMKDNTDWNYTAKYELYMIMHDIYYWADHTPTVDINSYSSPEDLMEALRVNPPDKWSYVTTKKEFDAYNSGKYYGFGFNSVFDTDGKLWIGFAYKNSPLTAKGIGRGWQISTINGTVPTEQNFDELIGENKIGITKTIGFISPTGNAVTYDFTKAEININTVLFDTIYTLNSKKIGYVVVNGFIEPSIAEYDACFSKFNSENVAELIVDLRYNGGGIIEVSRHLASLIGGAATNGKVYTNYVYNSRYSYNNSSLGFNNAANALSLSRVTFITTNRTASASELVINGLEPYMEVALIGSSTHGKPVAMPIFRYADFKWVFLPICISLKNANGVGDYFDGLNVDIEAIDDYTRKLGDINEASLAAALNYIGALPVKGVEPKQRAKKSKVISGKGLYEEIGAW